MSTNFSKHLAVQVDKETREITAYLKGDVSQSDDDSAVRETLLQLERQNDKTAKKRLQGPEERILGPYRLVERFAVDLGPAALRLDRAPSCLVKYIFRRT
jgi:hypothetical protein